MDNPINFTITRLDETASTNDDARAAAEAGASSGSVFWALRQSAGRGRQGRQWVSPEGNLYCSILLRPSCPLAEYGRYSFVAALAISDTVREFLPDAEIELKWPNDVLVGGRKISGILLEAGENWLVVGIGINIRHMPENPAYPVTSLTAESPKIPELEAVLDRLLQALNHWRRTLESAGFEPIRGAWLARARKGQMRVRLLKSEIHGAFADLDRQGNLRLILPDGNEYKVSAGDVFF